MELKDILSPLLKWWWLIVASTMVAAVTSGVVAFQQPPVYRATTTLMIGSAIENPNPNTMEFYLGEQLAATYADIAQRAPVREATMQALGLDWLPPYVASPIAQTQLLQISVTDTDPLRAQVVANELADQLILQTPTGRVDQTREDFINQQLDDLQEKIKETQDEIEVRQSELANLNSARQIADAQSQIAALQNKLFTLQGNYADLLGNTQGGALNALTVIEPASFPTTPVGPNRLMTIVTSAAVGFALAAAAAYLLEYLDNSIKSPEEIKKLADLPMLTGIPSIPGGEKYPSKLITLNKPRSPISESYRQLRTGIQFSTIDSPENTSVLVTSPGPTEGKSITAANLAVVIAQAGKRVLVLDADLRRPVQHRIFGLHNRAGLTNLLRDVELYRLENGLDSLIEEYAQTTEIENLMVITSGPIPPNPSELLGSAKMTQTLATLNSYFDYIVLDSPPSLLVTDSIILSIAVDGTLIVIDSSRTSKSQLKECAERLREVNATLLGVVVNRLSPKADGFYYYYNYYYYKKKADTTYGYMQDGHYVNPDRRGVRGLLAHFSFRRSRNKRVDAIGSEPSTDPLDFNERR